MRWLGGLLLAGCSSASGPMMSVADGGVADAGGLCNSALGLHPSARKDFELVADTTSGALLAYGGDEAPFDPTATTQQKQFVDELWAYSVAGQCWARVDAGAGPGARAAYAATWDSSLQRALIVAGRAGTDAAPPLTNEVWALDGTPAWRQLQPTGTAPAPRVGHQVVYDHARTRLLLFGGDTSTIFGNGIIGDTWELSFAAGADGAWRQLAASGAAGAPSPRRDVALALDSKRALMIAFGGARTFTSYLAEVWALDLTTDAWRKLTVAGDVPTPRFAVRAAYDAPRDRVLLFGGHDPLGLGLQNDTVAITLDAGGTAATFATLLPGDSALGVGGVDRSSPERREKHGFALVGDALFTAGGTSDCGPLDDTWSFDLTAATPTWRAAVAAEVGETCARRAAPGQSCPSDCGNPF